MACRVTVKSCMLNRRRRARKCSDMRAEVDWFETVTCATAGAAVSLSQLSHRQVCKRQTSVRRLLASVAVCLPRL